MCGGALPVLRPGGGIYPSVTLFPVRLFNLWALWGDPWLFLVRRQDWRHYFATVALYEVARMTDSRDG